MSILTRNRPIVVWVGLVLATLISFGMGVDHGPPGAVGWRVGVVVVLVIAFVKVRFVGLDFMELREAPLALRLAFEAWCVVVCGMVLVLYVLGG